MATKHPWDQLPGEDDEAFVRFLNFRNLGAGRSMRKAYLHFLRTADGFTGDGKRLSAPGAWWAEYYRHEWRKRATAWDLASLHAYGSRVAILHVVTITRLAERNAKAAGVIAYDDPGFPGLMKSVDAVAKFLNPEMVDGIAGRRDGGLVPTAAAVADGDGGRAGVA